ncbi:tRNA pseudouridine(38-40) synthase TruA [Algoriphagus jejuensis]|uniref:tRNA pseudouridine synthase A n=1 Tax=Algoriphagus jejuensis TaxID=419934 RepID=A0ABN1N4B6_9BACT
MTETKRYFLELSYKGTPFHGWQIQGNAYSVQECLENALSTYLRQKINVVGSGRTDTGVHASMQVCHFDLVDAVPSENFLKGINSILPKEIAIHSIKEVKATAHARFHAVRRSYVYRIIFRKNPFLDQLAWHCFYKPDVEKMNLAAEALLRHEDFECFSKIHTDVPHFRCQIMSAYWEQKDGELLFHITANRFLRGMVRAIVGTLVEVGTGLRAVEDMDNLILSRNRALAGKAVPAKGLFLSKIEYRKEINLD